MEIRQHTLEGMGSMMYNVIIFQDLRFRPSIRKRLVSVFKIVTLGTVFKTSVFGAQIRHAQKTPFTSGRKKNLSFQNEAFPVKTTEFWPRSIYYLISFYCFYCVSSHLNSQQAVNNSSIDGQLLTRLGFDSTIETLKFRPYWRPV